MIGIAGSTVPTFSGNCSDRVHQTTFFVAGRASGVISCAHMLTPMPSAFYCELLVSASRMLFFSSRVAMIVL